MIEPTKRNFTVTPKTGGELQKTEQNFTYGINDGVEITRLPNDYTTPENTLQTLQNCAVVSDTYGLQKAIDLEARGELKGIAAYSEKAEKFMSDLSDAILKDGKDLALTNQRAGNEEYKAYTCIDKGNEDKGLKAVMVFHKTLAPSGQANWKLFEVKKMPTEVDNIPSIPSSSRNYSTPSNTLQTFQASAILSDLDGFQKAIHLEAKKELKGIAADPEKAEKFMQDVSDNILKNGKVMVLGDLKADNENFKAYTCFEKDNENGKNAVMIFGKTLSTSGHANWKLVEIKY